ncbi:hypothetical protein APR03_003133 [Promicromonospora thailandica]|uniref:DUF4287 domain-containing protein n=2 Tax=Promicromonospora thailandica TaxID=765201 RepID=A0A9X2G4X3_9MICO|nr:hypothetical protein [Promicromonospora thailandica]BFF21797.1 hypothetical protein GCM10025730_53180 [Promicromonospora thailandica]
MAGMVTNSRIPAVERATGRGWEEWLAFFGRIGAADLSHHEIATAVLGELDGTGLENPAWWAQSAAVAYEQHIGRRIPGQRPDGTFQTSVSKATSLPMAALMDAWTAFAAADDDVRGLVSADPRVSGTDKRITWRAKGHDGESVVVISEPKKDGAASLVVQHLGAATPERNDEARELWRAVVARFVLGVER